MSTRRYSAGARKDRERKEIVDLVRKKENLVG